MLRNITFLAIAFLYFFNLGLNQVWQPNEAFYADASKNMLRTGDFLTPVYNGEIRLNKPPMTYWFTALSFFLFGINEFSLRLFQVLTGLGTGLITYLLARKLTDEKVALLSFVVLTLSFQFIANARYTSPEVLLTFFSTLSLYLWYVGYKERSGLFFFLALNASALGVLTKGPVGFLLPAGIIFIYLLATDPRELLKLRYYLGTLYILLVSGWWFLYQFMINRDTFVEVFLKENVKRIYTLQEDPLYFYVLDINVSFLPYSFIFYLALAWVIYRKRKELLFPVVWFLTVFTAFSLVKMKLPVYIMPAFPAMAIITASFLANGEWRKAVVPASVFLTALMVIATVVGAFLFKLNIFILSLCFIVPLIFLLNRRFHLAPAVAGFFLLFYLSSVLLPEVEKHRPYRDIGNFIKSIDPEGKMPTYELGVFHHNIPFYADRVIFREAKTEDLKGIVLVREDILECEAMKVWKVYSGSESRFFKFLTDIKKGRNFYDLKLCIFPDGR